MTARILSLKTTWHGDKPPEAPAITLGSWWQCFTGTGADRRGLEVGCVRRLWLRRDGSIDTVEIHVGRACFWIEGIEWFRRRWARHEGPVPSWWKPRMAKAFGTIGAFDGVNPRVRSRPSRLP